MRVPILLFCCALMPHLLRAEPLSDADREALLDSLEKLHDAAEGKMDSRYRIALAAYRNAIGSDDAAIELYKNCTEKVNFDEEKKKTADFREWKRKEAEKLADPGMRLALRCQLRWLVLTLQSTSDKVDRVKLAGEAEQLVDSIFAGAEQLKNQEEILRQPVLTSVFARAYDINHVKVEKWPLAPLDLDAMYDQVILPPYRQASQLPALRAAWIKRIQQEGARVQFWADRERERRGGEDRRGGEERKGTVGNEPSPAYEKFLEETQPKMQWNMEIDLYTHGDESGAATRMLALLEKHLSHPSAREWGDQLKKLLTPAGVPAKPTEKPEAGDASP